MITSIFPVCAWFTFALLCLLAVSPARAAEPEAEFKGRVMDVEGHAVAGARVFVYDSAEVRRSASFLSTPSDEEGRYRVVLPPGKYWAVARFKKSEGYGPLSPGDKHSGDPREIEVTAGRNDGQDFVVADLKDANKLRQKDREGPLKLSGRIVDEKGAPLHNTYAFANANSKNAAFPDYLSAWVDNEGNYTLYLPPGKYSIGAAGSFPPGTDYIVYKEMNVNANKSGVDIVWKNRKAKE